MSRLLLVLLFVSTVSPAETKNDFSYFEAGYANAGTLGFIVDANDYGSGPKFSGSWQFLPQWFVAYSSYDTSGGEEVYTHDSVSASERALSLGYVFHTSRKTDWYGRLGRAHRNAPDENIYPGTPIAPYTTQYTVDNNTLGFGARHRLASKFELSWAAEALLGERETLRISVNPRLFINDRVSLSLRFSIDADIFLSELNARWQF